MIPCLAPCAWPGRLLAAPLPSRVHVPLPPTPAILTRVRVLARQALSRLCRGAHNCVHATISTITLLSKWMGEVITSMSVWLCRIVCYFGSKSYLSTCQSHSRIYMVFTVVPGAGTPQRASAYARHVQRAIPRDS
jgi:hypothetical protein